MIRQARCQDTAAEISVISTAIRHCITEPPAIQDEIIANCVDNILLSRANSKTTIHILYWKNDVVVGTLLITEHNKLSNLFVDPNYQNQGIASKLLDFVIHQYLQPNSPRRIYVHSSTYAKGFYHRHGFIANGVSTDFQGGSIPLVLHIQQSAPESNKTS
ncbi:GNAT family N-acetyltransferase [Photobacterium minamisatsumaniensis]|uniref:GNAT family N-acetyltransferase n=1 Tax=Photobacterium minamisatsumaniensis TaxID=2910233 RepID=UPI003D0CA466